MLGCLQCSRSVRRSVIATPSRPQAVPGHHVGFGGPGAERLLARQGLDFGIVPTRDWGLPDDHPDNSNLDGFNRWC